MEPKDNEKFNPWDVTDLDIYLKYCCPECDSQHDTKDFFIHHALLEHPKAGEVLEYPKEKWDLKEEIIESDDYLEDLPSDNLGLIEPEIYIINPQVCLSVCHTLYLRNPTTYDREIFCA